MTVKIIPNDKGNPPGKLADVELHFTSGPSRRHEADWICSVGASNGRWAERDVPGEAILGERRATELRAAAAAFDNGRTRRSGSRRLILEEYAKHETEVSEAVR